MKHIANWQLLPVLGLAAILLFGSGEPSNAAPQIGQESCKPVTVILSNGNCPGYQACSVALDALFFGGGPGCSGCLWLGIGTLVCDGSVIYSTSLNLSSGCEDPIQEFAIPCPMGSDFGVLLFTCSICS